MRIGLFDSRVGGLTVLKEIRKQLKDDDFVYLADTARLPYGNKSPETILRYSIENSIFLVKQDVDLIVIACNTASAASLETLQKVFKVPVIGVITPAIEDIVKTTKNNTIAVLGTKRTISSRVYEKKIKEQLPEAIIIPIVCPLLASLIEEQCHTEKTVEVVLLDYIEQPIIKHKPDTLVLGCTHYPLVQDIIQKIVGPDVRIIDPSKACAEQVSKWKEEHCTITHTEKKPFLHFFVSDGKEHFDILVKQFLGTLDAKEVTVSINTFTPNQYFI